MKQPKKRVTVYLEPDLHMELKIKAARTGYTVSDWVNDILAKSLAEEAVSKQAQSEDQWEETLKALREPGKS
jgi:plasmid stability protein